MPERPLFGTRLTAYVIDGLIVFAVQWLAVFILGRLALALGLGSERVCGTTVDQAAVLCRDLGPVWVLVAAILVATTFGYYAWFDGVDGATPGKRYMGLRVVDHRAAESVLTDGAGTDGAAVEPAGGASTVGLGRGLIRAIIRQAIWIWVLRFIVDVSIPAPVYFVLGVAALVPLVWAAFASDGRGIADLAAGSAVVTALTSASKSASNSGSGRSAGSAEAPDVVPTPPRIAPPIDPSSTKGGEPGAFGSQLRP